MSRVLDFSDGLTSASAPILIEPYQNIDEKNQPFGYAGLDGNGKVEAAQLPSYVDDVLEFATFSAFPLVGEAGKIYIAIDTLNSYRWSGSAYFDLNQNRVTHTELAAAIASANAQSIINSLIFG